MGKKRKHRRGEYMTSTVVVPAKPKEVDPALLAMVRNATSTAGWADMSDAKPIHYAIARDGLYLVKRSNIGTVQLQLGKAAVPSAPVLTEGFDSAVPLIPWDVFSPVIAFLKAVKDKHDTEGLVRFYYDSGEWRAHVPSQVVSCASVNVADNEPDQPGLFAAEIHSHPGSSSVFSGTDDAHEQIDRIFMCVAFPKGAVPTFHARVGTGLKAWLDLHITDLVDCTTPITITASPRAFAGGADTFPYAQFPEEWMEKVTKERPMAQSGLSYIGLNPEGMSHNFATAHERPRIVAPSHQYFPSPGNITPEGWLARAKARRDQEAAEAAKVEQWLRERTEAGELLAGYDD